MSQADEITVTSKDEFRVKQAEDARVPDEAEQKKVEEITIRSYTTSMKPESDKNEALIMTHIPVQKINDAKYTLPENHEKEWVGGVLYDKPIKQLELPNQPEKKREMKPITPIKEGVLFPNPFGIKRTVNALSFTPNQLTAQSLGFKLEPLKQANEQKFTDQRDTADRTPVEKLLNKAKLRKNGLFNKIKDLKTQDQIVNELANVELSDDELEGRSVCQEVDYSDRKKAMKEIK